MKVRFAESAELDLEAIADYIATDNPRRALSFIAELRSKCLGLADFPERFPLLQDLRKAGIRKRTHRNYLIFYMVEDGTVNVLHILHGAREYNAILSAEIE